MPYVINAHNDRTVTDAVCANCKYLAHLQTFHCSQSNTNKKLCMHKNCSDKSSKKYKKHLSTFSAIMFDSNSSHLMAFGSAVTALA